MGFFMQCMPTQSNWYIECNTYCNVEYVHVCKNFFNLLAIQLYNPPRQQLLPKVQLCQGGQ